MRNLRIRTLDTAVLPSEIETVLRAAGWDPHSEAPPAAQELGLLIWQRATRQEVAELERHRSTHPGPANLPRDGVTALEGLVESDWIEVPFTMSWKLTRPGLPVRFEHGEPFAMIVPQGRRDLERYRPTVRPLGDAPELLESARRWTARGEREQVRAFAAEHVPDIGGPEWDGSYLRGDRSDGSRFEDHRVRRALQPFTPPQS
jgi:hypothetical protein